MRSLYQSVSQSISQSESIISFHINDKNNEIEKFQLMIEMFELLQNSYIVILLFLRHKTEGNVKVLMQSDLIRDDHQRHLIAIRFIRAVHDKNLIINLQDALRTFL